MLRVTLPLFIRGIDCIQSAMNKYRVSSHVLAAALKVPNFYFLLFNFFVYFLYLPF
jgi:hypothetical protein